MRWIALVFLLFSFVTSCTKEKQEYISFIDMFPYMTKKMETRKIVIGAEDKSDKNHLPLGWGPVWTDENSSLPFRWAYGKVSKVIAHFSAAKDKEVILECLPLNPSQEQELTGEIYVNNIPLTRLRFTNPGRYTFQVPGEMLLCGSNEFSFVWKPPRKPTSFRDRAKKTKRNLRLYSMMFRDSPRAKSFINPEQTVTVDKEEARVIIPTGWILEYYIDLPRNPILKFSLSANRENDQNSLAYIAISDQDGNKSVHSFSGSQLTQKKEITIKLNKFAKETARIAFSNPDSNHRMLEISWNNPVVLSSSERSFSFLENKNGEPLKALPQDEKKTQKMPHVFIYLVDALRADHLSCYGYEKETTPFIDDFAKEAMLMKKCFANASWTKPAVASILTGLYPNKHRAEERFDKLSSEVTTISKILKQHGYSTIYLTSNGNVGEEFNFIQDIDHYSMIYPEHRDAPNRYFSSEALNHEFFNLIDNNPDLTQSPLFAYIHTVDPHDPYTPRTPFLKFKRLDLEKRRKNLAYLEELYRKRDHGGLSKEDMEYVVSLYDCEILHNDHHFGQFISFLKRNGLYENSIIIFTSDHGEQFLEHGGLAHGSSIYNEEIHIPLIMRFPNGEYAGLQTDIPVSEVDIFPTILDHVGIEILSDRDGESIRKLLNKNKIRRTIFIKEYLDGKNIVGFIKSADQSKHIVNYRGLGYTEFDSYEVYDIASDFAERDNLFDSRDLFTRRSIKFQSDIVLSQMESTAFKKEKPVDYDKLDAKTIEILKALGYIK
jgi:arylsulfatase A-like enzyme